MVCCGGVGGDQPWWFVWVLVDATALVVSDARAWV